MSALAQPPEASPLRFRSVSRSHAGRRRTVNEDRLLERGAQTLWAVADGMGGHQAGDVAASRLIEALSQVEHGASGYACIADIEGEVRRVNAELFAEQAASGATSGSTVVTLLAHEGHYACLWAGDSRAYHLRDGAVSAITRDHSVVQELVDGGALPEARRKSHPSAHVITRAVGSAPSIDLDRRFAPIQTGDLFVLCSDGLTACVTEDELAGIDRHDLAASADWLLTTTLARQAPDNVSFILIAAD